MMAGALIVFASIHASAQSQIASQVKILRTPDPGVIKLLYANESTEALHIRFFDSNGEVGYDRISGKFPNGFLKKYDVRDLQKGAFWIEVTTPGASVVYRVTTSKDGKSFSSFLEKESYQHQIVASK